MSEHRHNYQQVLTPEQIKAMNDRFGGRMKEDVDKFLSTHFNRLNRAEAQSIYELLMSLDID